MRNNPVSPSSNYQPSLGCRLQHSKALVAIVAVLGVTVMALAAADVVNRSDAQSDVPKMAATTSSTSASKLVADGSKFAPVTAVKRSPIPTPTPAPAPAPAPAVVAKASPVAVCADCGTVQSVTAVQRQGQVNGVPVGNTTIGLGTVAGGVIGGLLGNQVGKGTAKPLLR